MGSRVSLRVLLDGTSVEAEVVGALVEWQITSLETSLHKEGVPEVLPCLIKDALEIYDAKRFPLRRARVLLRQLEASYTSNAVAVDISSAQSDLEALLATQVCSIIL